MNAGLSLNTKNSISPSILGNFNLGDGREPQLGNKLFKFALIQGLGESICRHLIGGEVFNLELTLFGLLTDPAVVDIDMSQCGLNPHHIFNYQPDCLLVVTPDGQVLVKLQPDVPKQANSSHSFFSCS